MAVNVNIVLLPRLPPKNIVHQKVVILVVLTTQLFRFSLPISQLMAKAIPVRGAKFLKSPLL
ncbi:hypothetical protein D9D84_24620 [Escherichia coli]|nr:hypothetical protein [Escherichia coli]